MSASAHIRVLPIQVANKIAAGEVVDRPAAVVKELVENAFDAGATQIDVVVTAGGRKLIAVRDDGRGMNRDDALLAIERHATSKIRDVDDIEHIATLGFRGEAMAAIASVSRLRLATCARGETVGSELSVAGGTLQDVRDAGYPAGTTVEVRDLFFNVPARRKFLRAYQTELFHVRDTFIVQALAHPDVGMSLTVDGRETYRLPGNGELRDRLRELFGPDLLRNLQPVNFGTREIAVTGFVSAPSVTRNDRNEQYVFVNRRPVAAAQLSYAIREGYAGALAKGRHPSVFLFVEMDAGLVDVNVHPTKKEVRFRRPSEVRDTIILAVRRALGAERETGAADRAEDVAAEGLPPWLTQPVGVVGPSPPVDAPLRIEDLPPTRAFRYPRLPATADAPAAPLAAAGGLDDTTAGAPDGNGPHPGAPPPDAANSAPTTPWQWCRVVGQLRQAYVVLETEEGMVLMDPRAAHERILFERLMAAIARGAVETQSLLIPETIALSHRDAGRLRRHLGDLKAMGVGVADFGADSFVLDELPTCLANTPGGELLAELVRAIEEGGTRGGRPWLTDLLAQAACQAAVRHRQVLSQAEIERLVVDLAQCDMPYTSPRGRPTLILTSITELNRKFGR
jgi:DNA mismatch repair protein MutL